MSDRDPGKIPTTTRRDIGGIGIYLAIPLIGVALIIAFAVLR